MPMRLSGHNMKELRDNVHKYVAENLQLKFQEDPAWPQHRAANHAVVNLLCCRHVDPDERGFDRKRRASAGQELLRLLPGAWHSQDASDLVHYCPLNCCASREQAVSKICAALDCFLLTWRPKARAPRIPQTGLYSICIVYAVALKLPLSQ